MSISFLRKLFGDDDSIKKSAEQLAPEETEEDQDASAPVEDLDENGEDGIVNDSEESSEYATPIASLEQFVVYIVKNLVDAPDKVVCETVEKNHMNIIQIRCAKNDIGKIIGKSGKTISALRLLVQNAAGRNGRRISVDVLD